MDDDLLSYELLGHRKLLRNIEEIPDDIQLMVYAKAEEWIERLYDQVVENITARLDRKTGRLEESMDREVKREGSRITGRVFSRGVPYARIQEEGGVTPLHMIYPRNGKVLAFMASTGQKVVATKVSHPGGRIPAANFMRDARREISPKVSSGLYYYLVRKLRSRLNRGL